MRHDAATLVPELIVSDLRRSLDFWVGILGFSVAYDRPEEGFAYVVRDGAEVMLEERKATTRQWITGPLEAPFGRGINFQIHTADLDACLNRLDARGAKPFMAAEEKWYRAADTEIGVRQAILQDPDGYLVRLSERLGTRPLAGADGAGVQETTA